MYNIDPNSPVNHRVDSLLSIRANKAQIISTWLTAAAILVAILFGIVTYALAKKTYELGIQTENNKDQLDSLNKIITSLSTENTLMQSQNNKIDKQLKNISLQNKLIDSGLLLSSAQLKQLNIQAQQNQIALNNKRQNDIYHLYVTNNFLRITNWDDFFAGWANPYSNRLKITVIINQIDSAISTQLTNDFLNSYTLGIEWYNLSLALKRALTALTDPDFDHTVSVSMNCEDLSDCLEQIARPSTDALYKLIPRVDSILKLQPLMKKYY